MSLLSSHTVDSANSLLDYDVIDQSGDNLGTLHALWADTQTGKLEFVGVKTGWLFGQNHVVPVDKIEIDNADRTVRIPYTSEFIKGAMSLDADATISDAQETEIYRYFQLQGHSGSAAKGISESEYEASETRTASTTAAATGLTAETNTAVAADTVATGRTVTDKDTIEVPLTEEKLSVGKRTVDAGQVRLRKIVRTEIVNQPVEIRHEDVVIERISAADVRSGAANTDFKEEVIDVPLTREEVVVQKDAQVTGAVRLHKTSEAEQQTVSETLRKEDVEVLRDGKTVTETHEVSK